MYKLVALDVDDTLLNSKHELSERNRETIKRLSLLDINFALATGRSFQGIKSIIDTLGLSSPQITNHGAIITLPSTSQTVFKKCIPKHLGHKVIRLADELNVTVVVVRENSIFAREHNVDTDYMQTYLDPEPTIVKELVETLEPEPTHLMIITYGNVDVYENVHRLITRQMGNHLNIYRTSPFFIEILHKNVTKGNALKMVASRLNIKKEEIISIGDSQNDVSMFSVSGLSIAMGNAITSVKEKTNLITADCDSDGVAKALEEIF